MHVHTIEIHLLALSEFQVPLGANITAACQPHQMKKASGCLGFFMLRARFKQRSRCRVPKESRSVLFKANLQLRTSPNPTNLPPTGLWSQPRVTFLQAAVLVVLAPIRKFARST